MTCCKRVLLKILSPEAKFTLVRIFISVVAFQSWPLHRFNIKIAFLHGDFNEKVYINQSPGFVAQGEYERVCHLRRSLYSLKESPYIWFDKFSEALEEFSVTFCVLQNINNWICSSYRLRWWHHHYKWWFCGISSLKLFLHTE